MSMESRIRKLVSDNKPKYMIINKKKYYVSRKKLNEINAIIDDYESSVTKEGSGLKVGGILPIIPVIIGAITGAAGIAGAAAGWVSYANQKKANEEQKNLFIQQLAIEQAKANEEKKHFKLMQEKLGITDTSKSEDLKKEVVVNPDLKTGGFVLDTARRLKNFNIFEDILNLKDGLIPNTIKKAIGVISSISKIRLSHKKGKDTTDKKNKLSYTLKDLVNDVKTTSRNHTKDALLGKNYSEGEELADEIEAARLNLENVKDGGTLADPDYLKHLKEVGKVAKKILAQREFMENNPEVVKFFEEEIAKKWKIKM